MVWADVAVVNGGVRLRDPVRIFPMRISSDLCQQPQLHRTTLVVPPEEKSYRMLLVVVLLLVLLLLFLLISISKVFRTRFWKFPLDIYPTE